MALAETHHACAVLAGSRALLIRGPSGSGKSLLARRIVLDPGSFGLELARLIADDRVHLDAAGGRLIVRSDPRLAGQLECRGLGILRVDSESSAVVGAVIDLSAADASRLPDPSAQSTTLLGVSLPRLAVPVGVDPAWPTAAFLATQAFSGIKAPLCAV